MGPAYLLFLISTPQLPSQVEQEPHRIQQSEKSGAERSLLSERENQPEEDHSVPTRIKRLEEQYAETGIRRSVDAIIVTTVSVSYPVECGMGRRWRASDKADPRLAPRIPSHPRSPGGQRFLQAVRGSPGGPSISLDVAIHRTGLQTVHVALGTHCGLALIPQSRRVPRPHRI